MKGTKKKNMKAGVYPQACCIGALWALSQTSPEDVLTFPGHPGISCIRVSLACRLPRGQRKGPLMLSPKVAQGAMDVYLGAWESLLPCL
jgi:hypothetical protein